eukprot:CAMPEP_0174288070 /NCGR_PEP_ID=MMETSP0809-20121228/18993_1 /TAXON_ID=73025 ORGANISM="Eutreptiella gymnastica-like, Strain CCMP1594" /NCGR_SAMPLE_ID=MMETSP0809 /ASSEMBLY_ACC=CAM_ASM_000658 /LENGTH=68 /DNA_ID=CAMNT_0015384999 /DNA_START=106 /DNA_END=309 /DNA_ORIENTATION=+
MQEGGMGSVWANRKTHDVNGVEQGCGSHKSSDLRRIIILWRPGQTMGIRPLGGVVMGLRGEGAAHKEM